MIGFSSVIIIRAHLAGVYQRRADTFPLCLPMVPGSLAAVLSLRWVLRRPQRPGLAASRRWPCRSTVRWVADVREWAATNRRRAWA